MSTLIFVFSFTDVKFFLLKKILLLSALLFIAISTNAQSISQEEAKTLIKSLADSKPDTIQMKTLLQLAKYHVFKPGENKNDLDSAVNLISQAESLNALIKSKWANGYILLVKSYLMREKGQRDSAKELVRNAVTILNDEADKDLAGEASMDLAGYYDYNNADSLAKRIELVSIAVKSYDQSGNIKQKAASLQMLGDLYKIKGSNYIALQHLQASLDAYSSINYKQLQGIYCLMGFILARLRDFSQALDKQLLALKTAELVGDSSMQLCEIFNYLGELHLALSEKEKAIYYYTKALEVAKKHNDIFAIYIASVNIANVRASMNEPYKALDMMKILSSKYEKPKNNNLDYNIARCYISSYSALKQFEKARPYANQLLDMVNTLKLSNNASISNYTVAIRFFIAAGEINEANKYLEKHNEIASKLNNFYYLAAIINALPEKPILIGHSLGGLIVQLLMQQELGAIGVAMHSFPPSGVGSLRFSLMKAVWEAMAFFSSSKKTYLMPFATWRYAMINGLEYDEQKELYYRYATPESKKILREAFKCVAIIDFKKEHAPLLFTAGGMDKLTPPSINFNNYKRYADRYSTIDYKEFKDHAHLVFGHPAWKTEADYVLHWLSCIDDFK